MAKRRKKLKFKLSKAKRKENNRLLNPNRKREINIQELKDKIFNMSIREVRCYLQGRYESSRTLPTPEAIYRLIEDHERLESKLEEVMYERKISKSGNDVSNAHRAIRRNTESPSGNIKPHLQKRGIRKAERRS